MEYIAKIIEDDDGRWLVEFPDCPGCQTFGETRDEAIAMAREALEGWLETGLEHGDVPPHPAPHRGVAIRVRPRVAVAIQIRWLRDRFGLTQGELARRVGVSQQQIAKLENPNANPTLSTLDILADKLDAQLDVVLVPRQPPSHKPVRRVTVNVDAAQSGIARQNAAKRKAR
jgi:antitoxin HicB